MDKEGRNRKRGHGGSNKWKSRKKGKKDNRWDAKRTKAGGYQTTARQNDQLAKYYKAQNIVPDVSRLLKTSGSS